MVSLPYIQVEGNKQFPCTFCDKVCKSKGGRTRHQRSKHADELGESSLSPTFSANFTAEPIKSIIRDIGKCLADERLYLPELVQKIFKLEPSVSFVTFLNDVFGKFKKKIQIRIGKDISTHTQTRKLGS